MNVTKNSNTDKRMFPLLRVGSPSYYTLGFGKNIPILFLTPIGNDLPGGFHIAS